MINLSLSERRLAGFFLVASYSWVSGPCFPMPKSFSTPIHDVQNILLAMAPFRSLQIPSQIGVKPYPIVDLSPMNPTQRTGNYGYSKQLSYGGPQCDSYPWCRSSQPIQGLDVSCTRSQNPLGAHRRRCLLPPLRKEALPPIP